MARVTLKSQGELVSFLSAGKADIRSLKVYFSPKQSGTGDPSPENVRAISGWTGVTVYHNRMIPDEYQEVSPGTTHNLDWTDTLGTIYGGYVDLISGEVVEEWGTLDLGTVNWGTLSGNRARITNFTSIYNAKKPASSAVPSAMAEKYTAKSASSSLVYSQFAITTALILYYDGENNPTGLISYEHETPVPLTTLTPQSLQTLTGQNTFWSTADRIEVEYDLIETRDTWMRRRSIIAASQPHLKSLTGTSLQFETDMANRLKECRIHFTPIQDGTGDPSPSNVRPIRGYDSITIYNGQTAVVTIPFPQTIYGGYVDLVKGEVVEEWGSFTVDGTEASYSQSSYQRFAFTVSNEGNLLYERTNPNNLLCNKLLKTAASGMGNPEYRIAIASAKALQAKITADVNTPELFREWLVQNPLQVVAKLLNPITHQLTPQTIRTLKGLNNIWSNANGNIEVKFWTH